jgi:2-polyprenyl-6-hydroxyphenyl methylase/3-demethylubiquinone-9 3-methyltransferase
MYESVQFRPDADGHIFLLHPEEVAPLAAVAGLQVERVSLFTNPLTQGHLKTERLLHVLAERIVNAVEAAAVRMPRGVRERCLFQMAVRFRRPEG